MRVALGSDEATALTDALASALAEGGHEVVLVGPIGQPGGEAKEWAEVGREVGQLVASGAVDTAVVCCWTGTGVSIAANKVPGVRAALCTDRATAEGARRWNDANVLAIGLLGLTGPGDVHGILDAWFASEPDLSEAGNIARLEP
jgi:ribose 5-phosphate isomerase B